MNGRAGEYGCKGAREQGRSIPALTRPISPFPKPPSSPAQKGQAMAETAIFAILAVIMGFGLLTWIPLHRARTVATATAYACAQFLSQSPNPERAARNALQIAESTLGADWSATMGMQYQVNVQAGFPGGAGVCTVQYQAPVLFRGLGFIGPEWSTEQYISRSETWKARWQ